MDREVKLAQLDHELSAKWQGILSRSPFVKRVMSSKIDPRLYAIYMTETFHYTRHNARNQALVGAISPFDNPAYTKFCFDHAAEEAGHEFMALKDLVSLGVERNKVESSTPILETEAFIAYLYWVSMTHRPVARLGYSFWAETVYGFIQPLLQKLKSDLRLEPRNMTFFVAHSDIDAKHAEEVREIIALACKTEADWEAVSMVMNRTLDLTEAMLVGIDRAYQELLDGKDSPFSYLNATKLSL